MLKIQNDTKDFYKLWLPILGAILTQFSFSITDCIMVAPFGEKFLGGISIAGFCYTLILVFFYAFFDIFSNLLARKIGMEEEKKSTSSLLISLLMIIVMATVGSCIALSYSPKALMLFRQSPEILEVISHHLNILSYGAFFSISYYACVILLRVLKKATTTFFIVAFGSLINILGNWLFLYGPLAQLMPIEIAVAWTTIISRCFMLVVILINVYQLKELSFPWSNFLNYFNEAVKHFFFIIKKGTPVAFRNLNDWLSSVILVLMIGHFGTSCCAANQATDMISSAMYIFIQAACTTIGICFSKWIGSCQNNRYLNKKEVYQQIKKMYILAAIPSFTILFLVILLKSSILNAFSLKEESITRNMAEIIFFIHLCTFPFYFIQHISNAFLDGLFDTKIPSLFTFFVSYIVILPVAFVCVNYLEYPPYFVWIIDGLGIAMIAIFVTVRLFRVTKIFSDQPILEDNNHPSTRLKTTQ